MDFVHEYKVDLFVLPADTYRRIMARVRVWDRSQPNGSAKERVWRARHHSAQTTSADQVLGLVGERGIGKTWLLRYLAEDDGRVSPVAVYLDLEERAAFGGPEDYTRHIEQQVHERCGSQSAVFLLDGVPPELDEHLRALEVEILKPHLLHQGALVVMALIQPSRVCWRAPVLRGGEQVLIPSFDQAQTTDQLQRLRKQGLAENGIKARDLYKLSGGLPLLNHLLSTHESAEAYVLLLEYWVQRIPLDERGPVRSYLQALCALDTLEALSMQRVLDLYSLYRPEEARRPPRAADVRRLLQSHSLAQSMPGTPGRIALVDGVRRAARGVLQSEDRGLYAELEKASVAPEGK